MNICLVSQNYPPDAAGGISTQTHNKARGLARQGHNVHVLTRGRGDLDEPGHAEGVTIHRVPPIDVASPIYQPETFWLAYSCAVRTELSRLIETTPFDVIDFPDYGGEGFLFQLDRCRWNFVPVAVQLHAPLALLAARIGWPEPGSELLRVGDWMEGFSITHADAVMACSRNIADFVAGHYHVSRGDIDVVHCGVDAEQFRPATHKNGDSPTVLFVGNLAENKGILTLVDAVIVLRARYPSLILRIAARPQPELIRRLEARVAEAGAAGCLEFLGFVGHQDLPAHYQRADLFCSPATYEGGAANVYLEAMACACPVVASVSGGAPEVVTEGEEGFLVPPNDIAAVVGALDRVLTDPALRRRLGENGRRRVEREFAMEPYLHRVLQTYHRAIARSKETFESMGSVR
jgi:glycosyltransferase involved in cell wall biosynthesis